MLPLSLQYENDILLITILYLFYLNNNLKQTNKNNRKI